MLANPDLKPPEASLVKDDFDKERETAASDILRAQECHFLCSFI